MATTDTSPNVVYRGQIIRIQVPHYRRSTVKNGSGLRPSTTSRVTPATDELERRKRLLEARNRYHSEPDLIQATAAAVDEEPMRHTPRLTSLSQRNVADEFAPRTVVLRKNGGTFGFLLCGTTSHTRSLHGVFRPTEDHPASQYFDSVQRGSVAENSGLKTGDFLLEINGENVSTATHSHTVQLIRSSGNAICLKIITPRRRRLDRLRAPERAVVVSRDARQPLTATDNERTVNKTSSCVAGHSGESGGHGHLPTARSMPDLTAAVSHDQQRNDDDRRPTAAANAKVQTSSSVDYRDRVLYELTNQLRPLPAVRQPLSVNGSTDNDGTTSESRKSGDETSSAQRRPVPPPRGPSLSSRPHGSTPAVASQAMSTGSEFKELLVVSGQTRTSSPGDGHGRESRTDSTSTPAARSVISGEHLVLPSQLKKVHRSATDQHASKQVGDDDIKNRTGLQPSSLGGAVASTSHHAVVEHRSPAPKRPAPPPPTTTPVSNGEVNFLVMAEQARRQYIMSKLTTGTLTQNEHLATDSVGLSKAVNGSATSFQTNGRSHEFSHTADEKSTEQQHMPKERHLQTIQSSQANEKGLSDSRTVTVNGSSQAESVGGSVRQPCESVDTLATGPPPAIPPKRRQRHSSRVEIHNSNETSNTVGRVMSTVDDRGTDGGQTSTHELADTQLSENTIVSVTRDSSVAQDSSEQRRRSNAKLTRGKNVVVRRSGLSRPAAEDGLTVNGISSHRSRDDAEQTQQQQQVMSSVEEVGILPPPPDFAD